MADPWPLRLPFFFFGTLMDADVLGRVVARPVVESELAPAMLWGHRRYAVRGAVYPVIRQERASHVPGVLFQPRSMDERLRIDHFEAGEYEARPRRVQAGARLTNALVYLDLEGVFELATAPWSFERWQAAEKPAYLARCDSWMADYVPPRSGLSRPAGSSLGGRAGLRTMPTGGR
ncbi:MAG: gamma-glutamylcyclotransferase family protein [Pseudomonadota bacterium]